MQIIYRGCENKRRRLHFWPDLERLLISKQKGNILTWFCDRMMVPAPSRENPPNLRAASTVAAFPHVSSTFTQVIAAMPEKATGIGPELLRIILERCFDNTCRVFKRVICKSAQCCIKIKNASKKWVLFREAIN
ncbi:hypothetical protein EAF04_002502 [Stromatinia cepivora]|nr:hypothetical protein EAF04_002502 [Stromatinia cepivora]